jgi:hypothetical protein
MYNAAMQWNAIILFIPGVLKNVILSHLSKSNTNPSSFDNTLKLMIFVNLISTFIPLIVVFLWSGLIEGFYGKTFEGVGKLISLAVFITVLSSTSGVYFAVLYISWKKLAYVKSHCDQGVINFLFRILVYTK